MVTILNGVKYAFQKGDLGIHSTQFDLDFTTQGCQESISDYEM